MRVRALLVGAAIILSGVLGAAGGVYRGYRMAAEMYQDDPGALAACLSAGNRALDLVEDRMGWRRGTPDLLPDRVGP